MNAGHKDPDKEIHECIDFMEKWKEEVAKRDAIIDAMIYYCHAVQDASKSQFEEIRDNMRNVGAEKIAELVILRTKHELARDILITIQAEKTKWEIE